MVRRIYTGTGDDGTTAIHGGHRVPKDDVRIEANGCMDELNSVIGLIRSLIPDSHPWQKKLFRIQQDTMVVMSRIATPSSEREKNPNPLPDGMSKYCESWMDEMMGQLTDNGYFLLPGGTPVSAQLHIARTIARRAERRLWSLNRKDKVEDEVLKFVNRLSDLFFVMARYEMQQQNWPEEKWQSFAYKRKAKACNSEVNYNGNCKVNYKVNYKGNTEGNSDSNFDSDTVETTHATECNHSAECNHAAECECNDGKVRKKLHPLMLAGTGSDVGKSIIATALCRIFLQDGYTPAPFKAQNMALNSYATPDGLEIGRAQAVQAEAAGIPCHTDMNPLLLKPNSNCTSQVVLNGKPAGNQSAYSYFRKEGRDELRKEVNSAFSRLASRYNPIVMEGAGSISEINLRDTDLVNMPMAAYAGADVILVADIDRGGVFASAYGSIALQSEEDRKRIKGIIVNKFRGDIRLFESGITMMEKICGVPVLGVVPYYSDIYIEEEDSVELRNKITSSAAGKINIAVVLLRHISNFTDFNMLERDERVNLYYTNNVDEIAKADIIIVPGSKTTIDDLYELRRNGAAQAVIRAYKNGATVMGICGGYQMMGQTVKDPDGVEGETLQLPGLGLLPVETVMQGDKITRQMDFEFLPTGKAAKGYEIHMGRTALVDGAPETEHVAVLSDGTKEGCMVDRKCFGTYLHGILDNSTVIEWLLEPYLDKVKNSKSSIADIASFKEEQYDKLADHVRKHLNMDLLYSILSDK